MESNLVESFRYTEDEKETFVLKYLEVGTLAEACRQTNTNYETAKVWHKAQWFQNSLIRLRFERDKLLEQKLSNLIEKGTEAMLDRIENGEQRITKSGEIVTVSPGLAALTIATGTMYDKRSMLRSGGVATPAENILEQLAERLKAFGAKRDVIDVEAKEVGQT